MNGPRSILTNPQPSFTSRETVKNFLAVTMLFPLAVFCGCGASPYSIEKYKVTTISGNTMATGACLHATIKGPAAKLGLFLTDPEGKVPSHDGEPAIEVVQKERMISNTCDVSLLMSLYGAPKAGNWLLTVKTIDPEKIVLKKEITVTADMIANARND
jgi:hypothetical protein